jgi:hypothetical protein
MAAKRLSEGPNEALAGGHAPKRIKTGPVHDIKAIPTLDPSMTQAQVFYKAVGWVSDHIAALSPIIFKAKYEELLANISRHTLNELNLHLTETGDIVEALGQAPQGNCATPQTMATTQANAATYLAKDTTPQADATASQANVTVLQTDAATPPQTDAANVVTPQGEDEPWEVIGNCVESASAISTGTEHQSLSKAENNNAAGAAAQQTVANLTDEAPDRGNAHEKDDEDMEGSEA